MKTLCLSLIALSLGTPLLADDAMQMRNLENRVSALEQTRKGNGSINPAAHPTIKKGAHLWVQVEALYFHPTEDNLSYAIEVSNPTFLHQIETGKVKNVSYDWDWGVRAGLGYDLPHDGWDLFLNWTWFHTTAKSENIVDGTSAANTQTWTNASYFNPAGAYSTHASGRALLHWALLDFEFGREFLVSKWMMLRPFIGARGAWIHRNLKTHYSGGINIVGDDIPLGDNQVWNHLSNRYNAGGLRAGANSAFKLGYGFSFYGDLALSLLYGAQKLKQYDYQTQTLINSAQHVFGNVKDTWTTLRPMLDVGLGLRWDKYFSNSRYRIRLQAGWEEHVLFGFDNDQNFHGSNFAVQAYSMGQGNLGLSGVSFQARFDF